MSHPGKMVNVKVEATRKFQKIDGFGVNINSRYWGQSLMPAMELLVNDLGATLYRVDIWGKSNWIDPLGNIGRTALAPDCQAGIYKGEIFQRGWAMMRWLNQQGIRPYLTASGIVPDWMLAQDGKTLADYDAFTDMMAAMLAWAKKEEKIEFDLFGPLNETDIGAPEGPRVSPQEYIQICALLDQKMRQRGLDEIRLVVAEQANFNAEYIKAFNAYPQLCERVGVFGLHDYWDIPRSKYQEVTDAVKTGPYAGKAMWMTEFGDLEQSGDCEWYVGWLMASRLIDQLEAGFHGALVWDAFDNYHDHDEAWTIYGLLRTGLRLYTPKKRYYAVKQVFRFVKPGFWRVITECDSPDLRIVAFTNEDCSKVVLTGMNLGFTPARLNIALNGFEKRLNDESVGYYRTSEQENCVLLERIPTRGTNWPFSGISAFIPPACIFTLTSS